MHRSLAAAGAAALALTLAACSTSTVVSPAEPAAVVEHGSATPAAVPAIESTGDGKKTTMTMRVVLQSAKKDTAEVGPEGRIVYGWNNLIGPAVVDDKPAQARLQGGVWYVDGTGPFDGYLTLTFPDGSTLAAWAEGTSVKTGELSNFESSLVVIGGTGRYEKTTGEGSWKGKREGALGSAVVFSGEIALTM